MQDISIGWSALKSKVDNPDQLQYIDARGNYYIYYMVGPVSVVCVLDKTSSSASDFEANYKSSATSIT